MKSTFKIFFYLKKTTPRTNGCVPIMGRITIDGKFVQFSTKLEISPALWNQRTQRANIALPKLRISTNGSPTSLPGCWNSTGNYRSRTSTSPPKR